MRNDTSNDTTTLDLGPYARISLDRDDKRVGVKRQLSEIDDAVAAHAWPGYRFRVVDRYVDNDRSASKKGAYRPDYERLMAAVLDGTVNAIAVRELSRLWRQEAQAHAFLDELEERRLVLHLFIVTFGHLTVGFGYAESRMMVGHLVGMAAHETRIKGTRHVADHAARRKAGRVHGGGRRRYGYERDMTPVPAERDQVRSWCADVLAGRSLLSIARGLNEAGVSTVTGAPWTQSTVRWVLNRPDVAGYVTYRGKIVGDACHEPLVDRDTWAAVQAALADPARRRRRARRSDNLLTGLLTDVHGVRMTVGSAGGGTGLRTYRSSVDFATPKVDRTPVTSGKVEGVDATVEALLLDHADRTALLAPTTDTAERDALESDRRELVARLAEADERMALPTSNPRALDWTRYEALVAQLSRNVAAIDDRLATTRVAVRADLLALLREPGALRARWSTLTVDERRTILRATFDRVILLPATRKGAGFDPMRVRVVPTAATRQRWEALTLAA